MTIARLIGFLVFAVFLGASAATGQTTIAVRIATLPSDVARRPSTRKIRASLRAVGWMPK
jgi:hypothetical protein